MARLITILLFVMTITACALGARLALFAFSPAQSGAPADTIEIHKGQSNGEIARALLNKNIITDVRMFNWLGRATRSWRKIKAGEYQVSGSMTPLEVFSTITSGLSIIHPVTVREGENMYEIAADLESKKLATKENFLALCKNPQFVHSVGLPTEVKTLEGYLFPDTYNFNKTLTAQDMATQMVRHANQVWTQKDEAAAANLSMTRSQVITLASIIEKETGAPQDRPMISSVLHNRLKKKMRLQSDPTTIYGMWDRYAGKIHKSDLSEANTYNTYYVSGLPEGPISNPGRESIDAALNPAQSDYLFFVSHNDGTTEFTRSLEDHNKAVRKYQLDPKAREGKSWRDLNKKQQQQPQQ
jgi:UPF0755 protein